MRNKKDIQNNIEYCDEAIQNYSVKRQECQNELDKFLADEAKRSVCCRLDNKAPISGSAYGPHSDTITHVAFCSDQSPFFVCGNHIQFYRKDFLFITAELEKPLPRK